MERVLTAPRVSNRRRRPAPQAPAGPAIVVPGAAAGEWEIIRSGAARQTYASLEAAAVALAPGEAFRLELPVDAGLIQRLSLPPAEPAELEEMARIQLEKILPYPPESVGMTFQVIESRETEALLAVEAVHHDRLLAICQPLTSRGCWPAQVTFHALALAEAGAPGTSALIYREHGKTILVGCENRRLSFAQSLGAHVTPDTLARELPAVLLGAELEGVAVGFSGARLDERCAELAPALEEVLQAPVEIISPEAGQAETVKGDLSPPHWRVERLRSVRAARLKQRIWLGAGIYVGLLVLAFVAVGVLKFQVSRLDAKLSAGKPDQEFIIAAEQKWKTLAPATQPNRFLAEILLQVSECLPPNDAIQLTAFDLTPGTVAIQGEAPSTAAAVDFTEKLRARAELKIFQFTAQPPSSLSSGRARFNVSGRLN